MAVAVKNTPESQTRGAAGSLTGASLVGAVYVLASLAIVLAGVPWLWKTGVSPWLAPRLSFVDAGGLVLVMVAVAAVLCAFGLTLLGPKPTAGLRGGVFAVLAGLAAAVLISTWVGGLLEGWYNSALARRVAELVKGGMATGPAQETAAAAMQPWRMTALGATVLLFAVLLVVLWRLFVKRATPRSLESFEDQGWFTSARYKAMQGLRVRRATMLGLLLLFGAGVYVMIEHGTLITADRDWHLRVPFTTLQIPLLPDVKFTAPLLLAAAAFWFSYRVVNLPAFADFLIATEAEVNKVSWPTRRSVVQDTVVVLATVILMTLFLFAVDFAWGWILSSKPVGVLRALDAGAAEQEKARQADGRPQEQVDW